MVGALLMTCAETMRPRSVTSSSSPLTVPRSSLVVEHPGDDFLLGWSAEGGDLLFASDRRGTLDLWALPVADGVGQGRAELVVSDLGPEIGPLGATTDGSESLVAELGSGRRQEFKRVGAVPLRGKIEEVIVYGAHPTTGQAAVGGGG